MQRVGAHYSIVLIDRPDGSYWETWMRFLTDHLLKQGLTSKRIPLIKIAHTVEEASRRFSFLRTMLRRAGWDRSVIRMNNPGQ